jgi:hypothetical protein
MATYRHLALLMREKEGFRGGEAKRLPDAIAPNFSVLDE